MSSLKILIIANDSYFSLHPEICQIFYLVALFVVYLFQVTSLEQQDLER